MMRFWSRKLCSGHDRIVSGYTRLLTNGVSGRRPSSGLHSQPCLRLHVLWVGRRAALQVIHAGHRGVCSPVASACSEFTISRGQRQRRCAQPSLGERARTKPVGGFPSLSRPPVCSFIVAPKRSHQPPQHSQGPRCEVPTRSLGGSKKLVANCRSYCRGI
jgi:hypothetical protein